MEGHAIKHSLFRGTRPRVFATDIDDPSEGRVFVWAWTSWFERIEGPSGAVVFTPAGSSEKELREMLLQQGKPDLSELDDEYSKEIIQEFLDQVPLFPEAPELSYQAPFQERNPDEDLEHG
ncbi:MAG: hypothetical protein HYX87_05585 [Chloroflexi bacterium]|nr:hypothetical protein [Chloroflexota bacterium]